MTIGAWGEQCAAEYLAARGYEILAKNFRSRYGEIDLIVCDNQYLAFVEVKARSSTRIGTPAQAVSAAKQRRLTITAQLWLQTNPTQLQPRFDVIEVYRKGGGREEIVHYKHAFEAIE